ncbi:porin [Silicimonas sp. MF1-12-2]|uniref:porin n=1 Tax=Silicimonas sp. MF1-12-2 TaxID=3384793 RepID=UPI0039B45BF3
MKKVLLASTALVLSAGVAAADVSVGGDGRMGIVSLNGADVSFTSRIRISFSASGETDGGLAFGGSIRADNASTVDGGGDVGTAGSVFVEGAFGKLSMGDVSGAPEAAVGDLSGVGLTGLGDFNEMVYLSNSDRPAARWDYSMGDLGLHVSADNPGPAGDQAYGVAVTYAMGDISMGLGYESVGSSDHIIGGVSAGFGDATVKVIYGTADLAGVDFDQYGASLDYVFGAATVTAFYTKAELGGVSGDAYGIGAAYDLGGGASLKGGIVDGDALTDASYDFGISMSF